MNELGQQDIAAQIEHIHKIKTDELRIAYGEGTAAEEAQRPSALPYDSLGDGCGALYPLLMCIDDLLSPCWDGRWVGSSPH